MRRDLVVDLQFLETETQQDNARSNGNNLSDHFLTKKKLKQVTITSDNKQNV